WHLNSTVTGDFLGSLPLVIGMKVMIIENIALQYKAVNGAEGTLTNIKYDITDGIRYPV
ncbi:hypothetical protein DACRYDRAFT_42811, partial [Dacryopinax primogenitus]